MSTDPNKKNKEVDYTIRVSLSDGGEEGLQNSSQVPSVLINNYGYASIVTRTASFADLKKFAESGMKKYWGRNNSRLV